MMRRPTEKQTEFPLLEITYDPLGAHPVTVLMSMDWGLTGEVVIKYTTDQSLIDFNELLQFAQNAVADEVPIKKWKAHAKSKQKNTPPF